MAVTGLPVRFYWGANTRSSGGSPVMAGSMPVPPILTPRRIRPRAGPTVPSRVRARARPTVPSRIRARARPTSPRWQKPTA